MDREGKNNTCKTKNIRVTLFPMVKAILYGIVPNSMPLSTYHGVEFGFYWGLGEMLNIKQIASAKKRSFFAANEIEG